MYGKYPKCLVIALLSLIAISSSGYAEIRMKFELQVNGHRLLSTQKKQVIGMRFKGIGDWLLRKKAYSSAIKYYENAIQYLPNEADIFYNLGLIYYQEKIYNLAIRYFQIAGQKYRLPENSGKSHEKRYQSLIWLGMSLFYYDQELEAKKIAWKLDSLEGEIRSDYPGIYKDLQRFYKAIWGKWGKPRRY